ncbi:uncharacterized protein LOC135820593 [Sycon ciliatum]|uniref:uncharacterized protein LOC135820593 n=1 Tax=Sycon ciliatum TaxID=27933 RepID=UPI0031F5F97F
MAVLQRRCSMVFLAVLATVITLPLSYSLRLADAQYQTQTHCDQYSAVMVWSNGQCFCKQDWQALGDCSQRTIPHGLQLYLIQYRNYDLSCDPGYAKDQPSRAYGTCRDQYNCTIYTQSSVCTSVTHHGEFPVSLSQTMVNGFSGKRSVQNLYFQSNSIAQLQRYSFGFTLSNLRVLHLEDNLLMSSSFSTGWASPMPNLQELFLDNNKLTFTQTDVTDPGARMFSGLGNLRKLSMNLNKLIFLPLNLFSSLTNLQELHMVNCSLQFSGMVQLPFSPLSYLRLLNLDSNWLSFEFYPATPSRTNYNDLDIFIGLAQLETLTLRGNILNFAELKCSTSFPVQDGCCTAHSQYMCFFRRLQGLKTLDLTNNRGLVASESAFHNLFNLENLHLRRTSYSSIGQDTFSGLGNLRLLDLSENSFTELPRTGGSMFRKPITIDLTDNNVALLNTSRITQIGAPYKLILTNNSVSKLDLSVFNGVGQNLVSLDLSLNSIPSIPTALNSVLPNLKEINLLDSTVRLDRICPLIFVPNVTAEPTVLRQLAAERAKIVDFCPDYKLKCADLAAAQEQRVVCTCGQTPVPASKSLYYTRSCKGQCRFREAERYCPALPLQWHDQKAPAGIKPLVASCGKGMKLVSGICEMMTGQCNVPSQLHTVYSYITWPTDDGEGLTAAGTTSFCTNEKSMSVFAPPETTSCLVPLMSDVIHSRSYDVPLRLWGELADSIGNKGLHALEYSPSTQRFTILQLPSTAKLDVICTAKWTISNLPAVGEIAFIKTDDPMMNPSLAEELCRSLNGFSLISWDMLAKAWAQDQSFSNELRNIFTTQWLTSPAFRIHPRYYMSGTPSDYSVRQYWMEPKPNGHVILQTIAGDDSLRISAADPSLMDRITGAPLCFKFTSDFLGRVKAAYGSTVLAPPTPPPK